jgi:FkbH-like protein
MYEAEVNNSFEPIDSLPAEVVRQLATLQSLVKARTVLPWGEHCTECMWPTCYTTCGLYSPRADGNCRLFVDGMVRIDVDDPVRPYLLKLRFKQWAKLWTVGNLAMYEPRRAWQNERRNIMVGAVARSTPLPRSIKLRVLGKVSYLRRQAAEAAPASGATPHCFLLECYNPNPDPVDLTLTVRPRGREEGPGFQRMIRLNPGFVCERVPVAEIRRGVDLSRPFEVEIVPNEANDTVLYFGLLDFVTLSPESPGQAKPATGPKPWKCIVWDLDNTLWDGTLIEDGPERIRLREEVVAVVKEADRRGILHSIASKNNHGDATAMLDRYGLSEYFLRPQIGWGPKSQSVERIAKLLSIGLDSLAFVDDQVFEREEVRAAVPQVAVLDVTEIPDLLARPECQVPITTESQQRRLMYRQEEEREHVLESFQGDYDRFLRECAMQLTIGPLDASNVERVYELAQRTNQMNFSGARYHREELEKIRRSGVYETYVMRCSDRFGNYGIVGFGVVDAREPRLLDLMFSCRIQGKRVEHAFLGHVLQRFVGTEKRDFFANFRRTERNAAHGKVFEEIGFDVGGEQEGVLSLEFPKHRPTPQQDVVRIVEVDGAAE